MENVFERGECVPGDERVHVRQRRGDSDLNRLVTGFPRVWIRPYNTPGQSAQMPHLRGEVRRVPAFPSVAGDDDDRAASAAAPAPGTQEFVQVIGEPGSAGPVGDEPARFGEGVFDVRASQRGGDPGEAGADREGFRLRRT